MIVEMKTGATNEDIHRVVERAQNLGLEVQMNYGTNKTVVALLGSITGQLPADTFAVLPGVESVVRIMKPYKLSSREFKAEDSVITVDGIEIGARRFVIMAGPCAVESREQLMETALAVKKAGACIVRGGAFKPRTSPFSFQGLRKAGLELLADVQRDVGLAVVTEVVDSNQVNMVSQHAAILQVGARNMQNFTLLEKIGKSKHPVVLKRGYSSTVSEWLTAADYLLAEGNEQVILCERGIRAFEDSVRFSLDISSIAVVKKFSHLPVIVDPSHAAGHRDLVASLCKAAVAAGADGLLIEVHPNPEEALVDGLQSLSFPQFEKLMNELRPIAESVGRFI